MKPTIPDVLPLARAYRAKPGNKAWGSLHIVLADGNLEDDSVEFCLEVARERGDADGERLAALLALMSRTQRRKIARLA